MEDYIIRIVPLPCHVGGFTMVDENGDYNIYLNSCLSQDRRIQAYDHEVAHIESGHFYDDTKTVETKEREANGHAKKTKKRTLADASISREKGWEKYIRIRDGPDEK